MPVEQTPPDAWNDPDTHWAVPLEDQDFSDIDSDSSEATTQSMSTLGSFEVSDYFREVYGRAYPADSNIPPFVPLDNGEAARLELQHHYLKLLIGGNYFGPVNDTLQPDPSRRKRVLDIFTADGTWAQEMATEFPHVDFLSLDLIPLVPHNQRANVTFEVYDLYNGFTEPDASFDIVHTRRTVTQIKDYPAFIREVHRVLRPGGLLLFGQIEIEIYEYTPPDKSAPDNPGEILYPGPHIIQAHQSLPVMSQGMALLRKSLAAQSIRVHMWRDLPSLLVPGSPTWHPEMKCDDTHDQHGTVRPHVSCAQSANGFRDIAVATHILPTSPWHNSPRLRALGEIVKQIGEWNWRNFGLLFRQHGLSEQEADALIDTGLTEYSSCKVWRVMRYHTVYATKI